MYASPKRSALLSGLLHAAAIALVLLLTGGPQPPIRALRSILIEPSDIGRYLPSPRESRGGGGGGTRSPMPASQGRLPRAALRQFTPPAAVIQVPNPVLPMEPTIIAGPAVEMPTVDLARFGDPYGRPGPPSGGPGSGGGIGSGTGTGVGPGAGPGFGPGSGGGLTTGSARGSLTQPAVLYMIEPEYTDEARKAHIQGIVVLYLEVDPRGQAQNITVQQSLGLGLDERAVEAVRRWRFRPASRDGRPCSAQAIVNVSFRLL
jgi:protein TonB